MRDQDNMPLTTIDTSAALIIIDLQKGLMSMPTVHPLSEIIDRSAQLARVFRERGLPVVLVNVSSGAPGRTEISRPGMAIAPDFTELVPQLGKQPGDLVVTKQRPGAFIGTSLDQLLRERKVTQVFLTGVATSRGVEATAYSAYDFGYNVVFVTDAMTDREAEAHQHCVEKTFPRLGEIDTTANILQHLQS